MDSGSSVHPILSVLMTDSTINFNPSGLKKIQKSHTPASQSLLQRQQDTIFACSLRCARNHHITQARKGSNRMFGIIVIPRYIVVIKKCEQSTLIFIDSLF